MQPSLPVPTDNIYKFSCLFGLVLIVSAVIAIASVYSSSLDRKIVYVQAVIALDSKAERTKQEEDSLKLNRLLIDVTKKNEDYVNIWLGVVIGFGLCLSGFGAMQWHRTIQRRDDQLAELQIQKLQAEIAKIQAEIPLPSSPDIPPPAAS